MSFLAKGRRDIYAGRYIDAFYSHYFFLETQFAPGYSNPTKVKEKFEAAPEIFAALREVRQAASKQRSVRRMRELLKLTDVELVGHLVDTRGKLHHHALPRQKGSWHPDKHDEFEAESLLLSYLTNEISQSQNLPLLFDEAVTEQVKDAAKREGAEYKYVVEADGGSDRYGLNGLPSLHVSLPNPTPSHSALIALDDFIRGEGAPYDLKTVRAYTVKSTDGSRVLARYRNNTQDKRTHLSPK